VNADRARLQTAIDTVHRVLMRLRSSLDEGIEFGAASIGDADSLRAADAFVQRFQQSVEVMARRLFPALYRVAEGGERPPPLMTLLAYLEGHDVITGERAWAERVELRNALIHEYPATDEERAAAIGRAQASAGGIFDDYDRALRFVRSRRFLEFPDDQ
jgi:hypothetical protein